MATRPPHLWVDWLCQQLEPIVKHLVPGGTIALNISADLFEEGTPARSLYQERMVLALHDRLGLHKMAMLVWYNKTKPPGPTRWASVTRQHLNVAWEPVYLFCNAPLLWKADNRRVLQEHSDRHLKFLRAGGVTKEASYHDGAYTHRPGTSFANVTEGRIPRNVLEITHRCSYTDKLRAEATKQGLPLHGATFPLKLPQFLVQYLSEEEDLVVDFCAGWMKTARAAEEHKRRWLCTEKEAEYVLGAANGFADVDGFECFGAFDITPDNQQD